MNHSDRYRVTRTYVKLDFTPAWELNEKVVEKIFFTEDRSTTHVSDEKGDHFERFSYKQLIKGTLYYRGKALVKVEDVGFNNVMMLLNILWLECQIPSLQERWFKSVSKTKIRGKLRIIVE